MRRAQKFSMFALLAGNVLSGAGCECPTVSRRQYLNTAYAPAPNSARISTYRVGGQAAETATAPKYTIVHHAETGETVSTATSPHLDAAATSPAVGGVARGAQGLTADRQRYFASINNEIDALATRLQQIASQAKIKGAASEAALDTHTRAFNHSVDQLRSEMDNSRSAAADDWDMAEERIDALVKQARQSVDDATRDVDVVPVVK